MSEQKFLAPGLNIEDQDYKAFSQNFVKISENVFLTKMPVFLIFYSEDNQVKSRAVSVETYDTNISLDEAIKDKNCMYYFMVSESGIDAKRYYKENLF